MDDDINLDNDDNKLYETEPGAGPGAEAANFSAQAQKENFLAAAASKDSNEPEDEEESYRGAELVHKIVGFFERNKAAVIASAPNFGMLLTSPPQSLTEVGGRVAIAAGMVGAGHIYDRVESRIDRQSQERHERIQASRQANVKDTK